MKRTCHGSLGSALVRWCAVGLVACAALVVSGAGWPGEQWPEATPAEMGLDAGKLEQARDYALTAGGSGLIIYKGMAVFQWGDQAQTYDLKSTSKSIGVTLLGIALKDGKVKLDDPARKHHPSFGVPPEANAQTGWLDKITLRMLADQTAGFDKTGGFEPLLFEPGTEWSYSDGGPNWLAECVTLAYHRDLNDLMFERVFTPIGISPADIRWRRHQYRKEPLEGLPRREFGSGFSANVVAMSRIGYLYLRDGIWNGERILPESFLHEVRHPDPRLAALTVRKPEHYGHASSHYSLLWWNNVDGTLEGVPRDAFWSWGLYDSLTVVIPGLDLVIARAGPAKSWKRAEGGDHYEVLKPFLPPIVAALKRGAASDSGGTESAGSQSPVIREIRWAPADTIIRKAKGGDNWPITWADDGHMYTAYGDGNGFEPRIKEKLSLGLARVEGGPADFKGINIRSASAEATGNDVRGRKASGMLCVDGVLHLLARNTDNAQLASSADHGANWTWADWKFTESFGCPTFLNFGKNYAGARDGFVYVYSLDSDSAYEKADQFVLARVPAAKIREKAAYEYFARMDGAKPVWSGKVGDRGPVLRNPGLCYRSGVSYNAGLKRYLWCQILPTSKHPQGPRFQGGFSIYDAPEPWGPWTLAFHTDEWDVGPGETGSLPTKWMSDDGRTVHLVFSGDDHFAVRKGEIVVK